MRFVELFCERVPYLLGNDHVTGYLAARDNRTHKRFGIFMDRYSDDLKQCRALMSACVALYNAREYVGYYRHSTNTRRVIRGFRNLDYTTGDEKEDEEGTRKYAREVVIGQFPYTTPVCLSVFSSLCTVVVERGYATKARSLRRVVDVETWPKNADVVLEIEYGHQYYDVYYDPPHAITQVETFFFDAALPVKKLVLRCAFLHLDLPGLSSWKFLEEVVFTRTIFLRGSLVESLVVLPHLRTICIEDYLGFECSFQADLRAFPPRLKKVAVTCFGMCNVFTRVEIPPKLEELLSLPAGFRKWTETRSHCWQAIRE